MAQERRGQRRRTRREKPEFDNKLLDLARVTRVVKGGRRFSFRAAVVIGNRKGKVGFGVAKGTDVATAVAKAINIAKKKMIVVSMKNGTIPYNVVLKKGSARIMMKPAREGSGIISGGAMRAIVDLAGIKDIVTKSFGTSNKLNVAHATCAALEQLKSK